MRTLRRSRPRAFPHDHGAEGVLRLRAVTGEHGLVEHAGVYKYVGVVNGMHAFAATRLPLVYLHPQEIVSFVAGDG